MGKPTDKHHEWMQNVMGLQMKPGGGKPGEGEVLSAEQAIAMFSSSPAVQTKIRELAVHELQLNVNRRATTAHASLLHALALVTAEVLAKAAKEKKEGEERIALILIVGTLLFAPAAEAAVLGAMNGIKPELQKAVASAIPVLTSKVSPATVMPTPEQWKAVMDAAAVEKITSNAIVNFTSDFSAAQAKAVVKAGADFIKTESGSLIPTNDKFTNTVRYLQELSNTAHHTATAMGDYIATVQDIDGLCGLHDLFEAADVNFYKALVDKQSNDFLEQIAEPLAQKVVKNLDIADEVVIIDAYGAKRLAHVRYDAEISVAKAPYFFVKWVTPEMEAAARALGPSQVDGSKFMNRIPAPDREETTSRIVRIDYGGLRLAEISIEDEGHVFGKTEFGKMTFVRWIEADHHTEAEMKGGMQAGGINTVKAGDVKGVRSPAA